MALVSVGVVGLAYEALLVFTSLLAPYRFPIPYAVPIFDTPFVLVATGVGYLCLERHRLLQDFQSAAIGLSLWLAALLAIAHILTQPDYPGTPGFNPGVAPYLFFGSYFAAFTGVALATQYPSRSLRLTDRDRWKLGAAVVAASVVIVATVLIVCPRLPSLVMPPGRMTPFALWTGGVANGAVALWALWRCRRQLRVDAQEHLFADLLALAAFIWVLGFVGFMLYPYRYAVSWYLAGVARPLGVGVIFVALLREQVWLYVEARARLRDLGQLHLAGRALVTSLEASEIFDNIAREGAAIAQADASILFRLDGDGQALRAVSAFGLWRMKVEDLAIPVGRGAAGVAVRERRPVPTADLNADPRLRLPANVSMQLAREGIMAALAVPLLAQRDEVFGSLSVFYRRRRTFAEADLELLAAFGTQASVALENARAFDRLALKATHDAALQEFGRRLLEATEKHDVVEEAVGLARRLARADGAALLLTRPGAELRLIASAGWPAGTAEEKRVNGAIEAWVASALADGATVEADHGTRGLREHGIRSSVVVPLGSGGQRVGALAVYSRVARRFSDEERRVLASVAQQTAVALDKIHLYAELRENLERLQDTQAQLIQADKLKALGTLLSGMAHELNNPLSTIQLSVQLFKRVDGVTGTLARRVDVIEAACARASRIVRDLLVFARRQPPERVPVDINEVLRSMLDLQMPDLELNHIRLVTALKPVPRILADGNQLQQVFLNLFGNAIHAMTASHARGILSVRSRSQGSEVVVEVEDTGPGIPTENLGRIFDPFFTTKATGAGTGLGLSLAIGIVEAHGGRMEVENVPSAGARFTVALPIGTETTDGPAPAAETSGSDAVATAVADVLLIEDESPLRGLLSEVVRDLGHHAVEARNGGEALVLLREGTYDLVMLDLRLPDLDGQAVWQKALRDHPRLAARVVFMTGDIMNASTQRFLDHAGRPFLIKPFTVEQVGRMINEVLATAS